MNDVLDVELHDRELMTEIKLVGELMVAALQAESSMDQLTVDRILGVDGTEPESLFPLQRC